MDERKTTRLIFDAGFKFISIKEYVLFRLTGEFIVDQSIASASGLFDLSAKKWSTLALSLTRLNEESFSRIVSVDTLIMAKKEIATRLRLTDVPLIVGASDGCLAQWGSHAMGEKDLSHHHRDERCCAGGIIEKEELIPKEEFLITSPR